MVKIHLYDFEHFNTTTESIYELGEFNVLIVLKNGENLTNWRDLENREDVVYISEDLFGKTFLEGRYKGMKNLKAILTFGVGNVESMREMFSGCESLEEISSLSSWDVSGVEDMSFMFNGCRSLTDISALENWNTSNVRSLSRMFSGCNSLTDISALESWNVSNVEDMYYLFAECSHLKDVSPLAYWDVSNVGDMGCLFDFCTSLEDISALGNWDLSNVFNMTALFRGCTSLKDISPLSKWDLSEMTRNKSLLAVFSLCTSLKNISALKNWDVSNINRLSGFFEGCISLKSVSDLKKWDVSNVDTLDFMFRSCSYLNNVGNLKSWDTSNVETMKGMFDSCTSLDDISALGKWDVSNVKSINKMFFNCRLLSDVSSLNEWKLSENTSIISIFDECESLSEYPDWFKSSIMRNNQADLETRKKLVASLDKSFFKNNNLNEFDDDTQVFMVAACNNQPLLAYMVERSDYRFIQEKALENITDEEILTDIAIRDHHCDITRDKKGLKSYFYIREMAILKIENKAFLIRIAKELPYILDNFSHVAKYIEDDEEWTDIALNAKSQHIRIFALANIKSADSFKTIIDESDDEALVKVAKMNMPREEPSEDADD